MKELSRILILLLVSLLSINSCNNSIKATRSYYIDLIDKSKKSNNMLAAKMAKAFQGMLGYIDQEGEIIIVSPQDYSPSGGAGKKRETHFFTTDKNQFTNGKPVLEVRLTLLPMRPDGRQEIAVEFYLNEKEQSRRVLNPGTYRFPFDSEFQSTNTLYPDEEIITRLVRTVVTLSFK